MKGLAGKQMRGIMTGSVLDVIDNSGAKTISVIAVPGWHGTARRQPSAAVGDIIVASVKKGSPEMRRQVVYAIIVRQRRPFRRADGTMITFEDNAAVITTDRMR
jgi:large subunit ribosomal protein L14